MQFLFEELFKGIFNMKKERGSIILSFAVKITIYVMIVIIMILLIFLIITKRYIIILIILGIILIGETAHYIRKLMERSAAKKINSDKPIGKKLDKFIKGNKKNKILKSKNKNLLTDNEQKNEKLLD